MTRRTIGEALDVLAAEAPDADAVTAPDGTLTRAELATASRRCARLLIDRGVRPDDLVAIRLPNTVDFVVAACAIWRAGATPMPISLRLPLAEQRALLDRSGARFVVGGDADDLPGIAVLPDLRAASVCSAEPLPPLAAQHWKATPTSGSTGAPKIVLATAPAMIDPTRPVAPFLPLAARQLVVGPLSHSAPFTYAFRGLMTGHALVILPRFDARAVLAAIETHRITWVLLVPTALHRILRLPPEVRASADLSSLDQVVHLGAPMRVDLKRAWLDWIGPTRMTEVYAGTESNGLTIIRGDEWLEHPGSVGRAAAGSQVRIVQEDGTVAPAGVVGRVELRRDAGPASRYLGDRPAAADAWTSLGDDGRLDADGYLYLLDRGGDRITRAGTSLYPTEVEQVLEQHPLVRSAIVVGVQDADLGQSVHTVVDTASAPLTEADLRTWLRDRIDPEKRPDSYRFVQEPLRDDAGKARRRDWQPDPNGGALRVVDPAPQTGPIP